MPISTFTKIIAVVAIALTGLVVPSAPASATLDTGTLTWPSELTLGQWPTVDFAAAGSGNECAPDHEANTSELHVDFDEGALTIDETGYALHETDVDFLGDGIGDFRIRWEGVPDTHSEGLITVVPGVSTDQMELHLHMRFVIENCAGTTEVCRSLPVTLDLSGDWHPAVTDSVVGPGTAWLAGHTTVYTFAGCNTIIRTFFNNKPMTLGLTLAF